MRHLQRRLRQRLPHRAKDGRWNSQPNAFVKMLILLGRSGFVASGVHWIETGGRPVTYKYKLQDLFALLHSTTPALADNLAVNHRNVNYGLLSVGLKIH